MNLNLLLRASLRTFMFVACAIASVAQAPFPGGPPRGEFPPPFGGPPRGPGGMRGEELKVLDRFDKDGDKRLNNDERKAAREYLKDQPRGGFPRGGPRGRGGENQEPPQPGPRIEPKDVKEYPGVDLYDLKTLRTLFLEFENEDWEKELEDFHNTDVEVPARLRVDGKSYEDVGVHFRGMSSYGMVRAGWKRSLNLSLDFVHPGQNLGGYRTLNLLNSHGDPTFLRAVLYLQIAREYLPAPKANFVRVVINGESWGIYISAQQFNKDFVRDWYLASGGARWKVPGSPGGRGGLEYIGDDPEAYKRTYEIKTKDRPESWAALIRLCKVLNETPAAELEKTLSPILDIDGALKFLALENVLINNDGYWIRSSDYNLYLDAAGRFHVIPHDANETFMTPGGPGFRGRGRAVEGVKLDPLTGADDPTKPLLSKLLAVPELRTRYLGYVRDIARDWLDWNRIGPLAKEYQDLIRADVEADTRKLSTIGAFESGVAGDTPVESEPAGFGPGPRRPPISLKKFAEERREYLLNHSEIRKLEAGG